MLENIIKKTKNALVGSLMLAQLAGTSLANEPNMELYESVEMRAHLSTVNFYRPKQIISGEENKTQVEIITEQEDAVINQIEYAWIAIGSNSENLGKYKLWLETKNGTELFENEKELSPLIPKLEKMIILALEKGLPDGVGQLIEVSNYFKNQELEEQLQSVLRGAKDYFKDRPFILYHIPRGKIEGLTTGYRRILFEVPTSDDEITYWVRVKTTDRWKGTKK